MDIPFKTKLCLLGFLISIILFTKYPNAPHEYGVDGFGNHGMAFAIQDIHFSPMLQHPASVYALYPFSYAPGMTFLFASVATLTGFSMEVVILLLSMLFTLIGAAGLFMFTTEVRNRFEIKFFASFLFVFTPVISFITLWNGSTRGPFICLMTVLLWSLARTINARHKWKFFVIALIFLLTLPTIHHFALLLPILILALLVSFLTFKALEYTDRVSIYYKENVMLASGIVLALMLFFFYLQASSVDLYAPDMSFFKVWYIYGDQNDPLTYSMNILVYYGISLGVLMIYGGIGLANIIGDVEKTRIEWSLLFFILFFCLFLADNTYLILFVVPLFLPFTAIGMSALLDKLNHRKKTFTVIAGALLMVSAYYGVFTTDRFVDVKAVEKTDYSFYMHEETYNSAVYLRDVMYETNGPNAIHNDQRDKKRLSATSGIPMLPLNYQSVMVAYPEIKDQVVIEKYTLSEVYLEHYDRIYYVDWRNSSVQSLDNYSAIVGRSYDSARNIENLTTFRISWAVVNVYFPDQVGRSSQPYENRYSHFFASLPQGRYNIYENSYQRIYFLYPVPDR